MAETTRKRLLRRLGNYRKRILAEKSWEKEMHNAQLCTISTRKKNKKHLALNTHAEKKKFIPGRNCPPFHTQHLRGSLPKSVSLDFGLEKTLPHNFTINTTIHPDNEIAVRMRKLFILLPFPAFHCWTTVSG